MVNQVPNQGFVPDRLMRRMSPPSLIYRPSLVIPCSWYSPRYSFMAAIEGRDMMTPICSNTPEEERSACALFLVTQWRHGAASWWKLLLLPQSHYWWEGSGWFMATTCDLIWENECVTPSPVTITDSPICIWIDGDWAAPPHPLLGVQTGEGTPQIQRPVQASELWGGAQICGLLNLVMLNFRHPWLKVVIYIFCTAGNERGTPKG